MTRDILAITSGLGAVFQFNLVNLASLESETFVAMLRSCRPNLSLERTAFGGR